MSNRYRFYGTPGAKIVCVSSYAGRPVREVAICAEGDEYDYEKGCALARARVDVEIARRKCNNAELKLEEAEAALDKAERRVDDMTDYVNDAYCQYDRALENLDRILSTM